MWSWLIASWIDPLTASLYAPCIEGLLVALQIWKLALSSSHIQWRLTSGYLFPCHSCYHHLALYFWEAGELLFILMFQSWSISAICFFKDSLFSLNVSLFSLNVFLGNFNPISSYSMGWKIMLNQKLYVSQWKMVAILLASSLMQVPASLFNSHSAPLTAFRGPHCNNQQPSTPLTAPSWVPSVSFADFLQIKPLPLVSLYLLCMHLCKLPLPNPIALCEPFVNIPWAFEESSVILPWASDNLGEPSVIPLAALPLRHTINSSKEWLVNKHLCNIRFHSGFRKVASAMEEVA